MLVVADTAVNARWTAGSERAREINRSAAEQRGELVWLLEGQEDGSVRIVAVGEDGPRASGSVRVRLTSTHSAEPGPRPVFAC